MKKNKSNLSHEDKLQKGQMINKKIVLDATLQSLVKLNPKTQVKNRFISGRSSQRFCFSFRSEESKTAEAGTYLLFR